jgi:hypothetical protein
MLSDEDPFADTLSVWRPFLPHHQEVATDAAIAELSCADGKDRHLVIAKLTSDLLPKSISANADSDSLIFPILRSLW